LDGKMAANNALKEELKTGKKIIGVWGLGYIGYSSMAYFAMYLIRSM